MQVLLQPTTAATTRSMVMAANTAFTSVVMHTGCCSFKTRANNLLLGTFVSFSRVQSRGAKLCTRGPILCEAGAVLTTSIPGERFRLNNLRPQPGSRKKNKRKGRGDSAGQGGSCGFGMKGQKSRAGSGVRRGFEGGQMPLYRRLPKLKGIAGGMRAGQPKYIPINLDFIEAAGYEENEVVSFETLKSKRLINPSGRERKLPIKILGDGVLTKKLTIKARAYSSSAKEKLESAGCTLITLPGRKKWMKPSVLRNIERAKEYFKKKEAAKST